MKSKYALAIVVATLVLAACAVHAATRWGDFTLGSVAKNEVQAMLAAKNATVLEEGVFAPTNGSYVIAMGLPDDTHVLSSMFIFDKNSVLQGIFSKYPPEMFAVAKTAFGKIYRVAWVEYNSNSYPQNAQELAKKGGYELVITEKGEHAIMYDGGEFLLRLVAKAEGFTQVEIMTKRAIGL